MGEGRGIEPNPQYEGVFRSEGALRDFARSLGGCLGGDNVVGLVGDLGAGKTVFAKGLAGGLGVPEEEVASPTFVLHRRYCGRVPVDHFDAYRLGSAEDLEALGIAEVIEEGGLVVVEWADKVKALLPAKTIWVEFYITGLCTRRLVTSFPPLALLREETVSGLREVENLPLDKT